MAVKIKLTKGYEALVDEEDYERINAWKWHVHDNYRHIPGCIYAITFFYVNKKRIVVNMESLILGYRAGFKIDHVNNNGLDNTKKNLRFATNSQNNINRRQWAMPKSGYRGVEKYGENNYRAVFKMNRKRYHCPATNNKHIAALQYNILVLTYGAGFGKINEVTQKDVLD